MYVSALFVKILLAELEGRGWANSQRVYDGLIDPVVLSDARATISSEAWSVVLLRALDLTRDSAIGLGLGANVSFSRLHAVGPLLGSCHTLREAIAATQHYQPLLSSTTSWRLEERGDSAWLYCMDGLTHPVAQRTSVEATLALAYSMGRALVAVGSDEVWFQHAEPGYVAQYRRVFGCPLRFDQPQNALVFARCLLDQRLPHADPTLHEVLRGHADTLLRERGSQSVSARVRALLRYEDDLRHIKGRHLATRMNLKLRTLRRALAAEHVKLANLFLEAQVRIAKRALSAENVCIKEVAHALGFSQVSAFHRAFKRWTGCTPVQFIETRGQHEDVRSHDRFS